MRKPHKLSASEVAALVGGLIEDTSGGFERTESGQEVRPYSFGSGDAAGHSDFHALRLINERFCRLARSVFLPMLRVQPRVSAFPAEVKPFDDYRDGLENFVSLTISRIDELRGSQLIMLPHAFVSLLTGAYYGGALSYEKAAQHEFTGTEQRVVELVTDGLNRALRQAWRDVKELTFTVISREENLQFATFVDAGDLVVNCSFMVQLPGADPASFDILYPLQTLKPIAGLLRSRLQGDQIDDDLTWRDRLHEALMEVPLELSGQLCDMPLGLGRVLAQRPGEVLPLTLRDPVTLRLEGRALFDCDVGEIGGRRALSLSRRSGANRPKDME